MDHIEVEWIGAANIGLQELYAVWSRPMHASRQAVKSLRALES